MKEVSFKDILADIEGMPIKFFGDPVQEATISDGVNYRFLKEVWFYNEATQQVKMIFPADLVPKGLPIGDSGLPAYKVRPEKKQEMIDELKNKIENEVK